MPRQLRNRLGEAIKKDFTPPNDPPVVTAVIAAALWAFAPVIALWKHWGFAVIVLPFALFQTGRAYRALRGRFKVTHHRL